MKARLCPLSVSLIFIATVSLPAAEFDVEGHHFRLPDGYSIRQVAGPPLINRPISADFDKHGFLYVTESSGSNDPVERQLAEKPHRVVRLEDSDGDGVFDRRTIFADQLMFPEGILCHDGSLYIAAPPQIWKLTDTDGDGVADERTVWFDGKTLTHCANDLHGPYLGRDGWIYWCKGAFAQQTYTRDGRPWKTRASHLFRRRIDGGDVEPVITGGMDNPVEVVFTRTGEPIFTTTFFQHPRNGKRDGLVHAVYGGLFGKRHSVLDGHPRTGDLLPPLVHLGAAAPSGLAHAPHPDRLGDEILYASSFNMHKLTRHYLTPKNGTFHASTEDFLVSNNVDFHPTDVLLDADGSLLVVDTGGWYKLCCPTSHLWKPDVLGAIYRITKTTAKPRDDPRGLKMNWSNASVEHLIARLTDRRAAVRRRAGQQLVTLGDACVTRLATHTQQQPPELQVEAVWLLARIATDSAFTALASLLQDDDPYVLQSTIKVLSLHRRDAPKHQVGMLLEHADAAVRRNAAEYCGRVKHVTAVPRLLAALAHASGRYEQHAIIFALIEIDSPESTRHGLSAQDPAIAAGAAIAVDQMPSGHLAAREILPWLESDNQLLHDTAVSIVAARRDWQPELAKWLKTRLEQQRADTPAVQVIVAQFADAAGIRPVLQESLTTGRLAPDQQVALLEALAERRTARIDASWSDALQQLLQTNSRAVVAATIAWLHGRELPATMTRVLWPRLTTIAKDPNYDSTVRLQALALGGEERPVLPRALYALVLQNLKPDNDVQLQLAAVDVIRSGTLSPLQRRQLIRALPQLGPLTLQRILNVFARVRSPSEQQAIVAALAQNRSLAAIPPHNLKQLFTNPTTTVQESIAGLIEQVDPEPAAQRSRIAELIKQLPAGDRRRGYAVFFSQKAACSTCHSIGYLGGNTGPDLTKVGEIRTERDLLEAIVFPSASFVRSFEPVMVLTDNGKVVSGIIRDDAPDHLEIVVAADRTERVDKESIEMMKPSKNSIMPAGLDAQLTRQELADLVAFLKQAR